MPRAAEKAGLQAREEQMPLEQVSPLLFPVIALLRSGDACVVLGIDQQTQQAEVVLSQSDGSEQWLKLSELQAQYSGHLFLIKKRFRYDERSPKCSRPAKDIGSGARCGSHAASTGTCWSLRC
ncbi:hypothetical protein ACWAU3_13625 [Shewanella sp. JL219SE-S6]